MRVAALALVVAACSGGGHPSSLGPSVPGGPPDPAAMRALLAQYSPSGNAIVTWVDTMPDSFTFADGGTMTIQTTQRFDDYIHDGAVEHDVTQITTGVHEMTHAYASHMGIQLLVDRGLPYGEGAEAIVADGDPWLVPFTATFPAAELDATFPADARTNRYPVYVSPADPDQSTQVQGAYGLLDEFAAYGQDARTTLDFWPWVRDAAPADGHVVLEYVLQLDELHYAYAELELYLLHYLEHARTHHPAIYDALIANDGFRGALVAVSRAYAAVVAAADQLEPTVLAFAQARGVDLARRDGVLFLDGNPFHADQIDGYRATVGYLAADPYRSILAGLSE